MIKSLLIISLGFVLCFDVKGQDPHAKEKEIAFADFLFNTQQYEFAAQEYLKLAYQYPENALLKKRLFESFRLDNDLSSGLHFSNIFFNPDDPATLSFYHEIVKLRIISGEEILSEELMLDSNKYELQYAESLLLDNMLSGNWEQVHKDAEKIKSSNLYHFTKKTPENQYISPALAASLSTIIPGSGKIYAKRWKEGISSLLFVGLTGFQSYRGFHKSGIESAYGWIMGGLSFGFYMGNIYGSYKTASDFNKKLNEEYHNRVVNYYIDHY